MVRRFDVQRRACFLGTSSAFSLIVIGIYLIQASTLASLKRQPGNKSVAKQDNVLG